MSNLKKTATTKITAFAIILALLSSTLFALSAMTVSAATTTYSTSNRSQLLKRSNGQTTPYFTVGEFKCEHCNVSFPVDDKLVDVLHGIRVYFGKPVYITSGYRCYTQNKIDGGAEYSNHLYGRAADIWISGVTMAQVVNYAKTIGAGADTYYANGYAHIAVAESSSPAPTRDYKDPETRIDYYRPTTNLSQGSTGEGVKWLQTALNRTINAGLTVDGIFGPATRAAVINAQRTFGLTQDGIVGPMTRNALVARLK